DEQNLRKRYAESTIASEFSKIMDSMVQKNFIKFLLSQRQKKTPADAGKDLEEHQYNDLLKLSLQEKQGRNI
uniref:Gastric inhibitory polypeptide n=1 Tax=Neolamprologus brichardi TaxID=32507 RepID=A0A3Q4NA84_NEOBR